MIWLERHLQSYVVCLHCANNNIDMNLICVILYSKVILDIYIILHSLLILCYIVYYISDIFPYIQVMLHSAYFTNIMHIFVLRSQKVFITLESIQPWFILALYTLLYCQLLSAFSSLCSLLRVISRNPGVEFICWALTSMQESS